MKFGASALVAMMVLSLFLAITLAAGPRALSAEAGNSYLKQNAGLSAVETTPSGLQFETQRPGSGERPAPQDMVVVHYEGSLIDGTVFDSSYQRGEPAAFPVGGVIPGFAEGLLKMQKGGKYRLVIPSDLAYGPQGQGQIPPNAVLVFVVELLDIQKPQGAPAQ